MSLRFLAFCFGWLELGFVLLVAGGLPRDGFVFFSGLPCLLLMVSAVVTGAKRRPKTVADRGES